MGQAGTQLPTLPHFTFYKGEDALCEEILKEGKRGTVMENIMFFALPLQQVQHQHLEQAGWVWFTLGDMPKGVMEVPPKPPPS